MRIFLAAAVLAASLLLQDGCAKPEITGGAGSATPKPAGIEKPRGPVRQSDTLTNAPVLTGTEEGLTPGASRAVEERFDAVRADTFVVEDVETETKSAAEPAVLYEIGYRIQIAATADRAAADLMRERAERETGLEAYVDSEDGLYKVRVGDFADRKAAAGMRGKLEARYPGCWIVRTAIRTERPSPGKGD